VTAPASRAVRWFGLSRRARLPGAVVAVAALATLVVIGPPGPASPARAATNSYNQITGVGTTDSAVTVQWKQGLLNSSNQPITGADPGELAPNSDRTNDVGPLNFMYPDFSGLSVTVSQTQDITQQGITVTWTGGKPTFGVGSNDVFDFLQLMECYGDADTGPDPEDCEYGSQGLAATGAGYGDLGDRGGFLCPAGAVASAPEGIFSEGGDPASFGCDPEEPADPSHIEPGGPKGDFSIPFVPVNDPSAPVYGVGTDAYYNEFNTDEIQEAVTNSAGDGQVQFEALTGTGAPGLGCGEPEADGQARGCWLVIVPRGQFEPNGYEVAKDVAGITTSPLAASNWAQRIQIHLGFATVPSFCPIGTNETETVGTQIAARAVQSWQIALNTQANCSRIYGYSATTESASTEALASSSSGIGLAFTTIPIGSEAARDGNASTPLPPILYAPVAVTGLGFGFNISQANGYVTTPVKLTPELLASALTQAYLTDLPDYYTALPGFPGPSFANGSPVNPANISGDPQFQALNPGITPYTAYPYSLAPLLTEDHSALNQSVWEWIQADKSAAEWLDGTPVAGMPTVDPYYVTSLGDSVAACTKIGPPTKTQAGCTLLDLGRAPAIDQFPRAYPGCLEVDDNTTTVLSVSSPVATSANVTVTATVTPASGSAPAGTVTFYEGSTAVSSSALSATGTASFTTSFSAAGDVPLHATFTPENALSYNPSTTGTATESVVASTKGVKLGTATATGTSVTPLAPEQKCSLDLLPYANSYQTAAQSVLTGDNTATGAWDIDLIAPDGTAGYWGKDGVEPPGDVFMWTIADTPDLAADGLIDADLCDDDGSNCVGPSTESLTTALDSAKSDSAGLLEVNPASPGAGGYPLTDVVYAAVPTDQSAAALQNYAALIQYAAGPGQTAGVEPGDLPPGYLPLPAALRTQADLVADELMAAAGTPTTAAPLPARAGSTTLAPGSTPALGQPAAASATPSSSAYELKEPSAELVATSTPRQPLGAIRWTLLAVALVGAACATGGTVLRSARVPRWLHRLRP
jgi:hypothetical protein